MSDIKQPEDRKPKVKKFTFTHDGKTYTLPPASEAAAKLPGRLTRDAVMETEDETAEMRLSFAMLEACGASEAAVDAVYSKSNTEMNELIYAWMTFGDGEGTSVPQS